MIPMDTIIGKIIKDIMDYDDEKKTPLTITEAIISYQEIENDLVLKATIYQVQTNGQKSSIIG